MPTTTTSAASEPVVGTVSSYRQFGSWLDDASSSYRGESYASLGVGYWRLADSSQINAPMLGMGWGVTDRMQFSASVPFYHTSYAGTTASGLDDVYFGAKYTLIDPTLTLSEFGLAVNPVVEVLSTDPGDGRVHFALPVNVELRRQPYRIYGSAGYFTRGSVFAGGALEWTGSRMIVTGSLTQSYSIKQDLVLDGMGIGRQNVNVSGAVAVPVTDRMAAFVNVGRTLTPIEEGGTKLALSGGVSIRFSALTATP
ncbi:MAG TPA: hypothetical protein VFX15_08475 [Actinomycetes bacterium]|nr:hypothetical protein [Actinomycetes bacterium]